jgi:hypothetical protein
MRKVPAESFEEEINLPSDVLGGRFVVIGVLFYKRRLASNSCMDHSPRRCQA